MHVLQSTSVAFLYIFALLQAAVAVPDEGGTITVHSATQTVDAVQRSVATTLGIPFHQVEYPLI